MLFSDVFKLNTRGRQIYIFADYNEELFSYLEKKYNDKYIEKLFTREVFYCNRLPF